MLLCRSVVREISRLFAFAVAVGSVECRSCWLCLCPFGFAVIPLFLSHLHSSFPSIFEVLIQSKKDMSANGMKSDPPVFDVALLQRIQSLHRQHGSAGLSA